MAHRSIDLGITREFVPRNASKANTSLSPTFLSIQPTALWIRSSVLPSCRSGSVARRNPRQSRSWPIPVRSFPGFQVSRFPGFQVSTIPKTLLNPQPQSHRGIARSTCGVRTDHRRKCSIGRPWFSNPVRWGSEPPHFRPAVARAEGRLEHLVADSSPEQVPVDGEENPWIPLLGSTAIHFIEPAGDGVGIVVDHHSTFRRITPPQHRQEDLGDHRFPPLHLPSVKRPEMDLFPDRLPNQLQPGNLGMRFQVSRISGFQLLEMHANPRRCPPDRGPPASQVAVVTDQRRKCDLDPPEQS